MVTRGCDAFGSCCLWVGLCWSHVIRSRICGDLLLYCTRRLSLSHSVCVSFGLVVGYGTSGCMRRMRRVGVKGRRRAVAREWERGWERMFVYVFLWLVAISVNILTSLFVVSLSRVWVSSSLLLLRFSKTVIGPLGRHTSTSTSTGNASSVLHCCTRSASPSTSVIIHRMTAVLR